MVGSMGSVHVLCEETALLVEVHLVEPCAGIAVDQALAPFGS